MNLASAFNLSVAPRSLAGPAPALAAAPSSEIRGVAAPAPRLGPHSETRGAADSTRAPTAPAVPAVQQGAFVTPQTIASFAGATFVVQLIWRVAGMIQPGWGSEPLVALFASLLVGAILYLISETGSNRGAISHRERLIGIFIALINTLVIFSAAIGSGGVINPEAPQPARVAALALIGAA